MRIAPEGRPFIIGAAIIGVIFVLLGWMVTAFAWAVVLVWVVVMLLAMTGLALVWNDIQRRHPRLAVACRVATLAVLVYPLV